jgi:hypothetical protein
MQFTRIDGNLITLTMDGDEARRLAQACAAAACPCFGSEAGESIPETRKERPGQPRDNPAVGYLFEALAAAFENAALVCAYQCGTWTRPSRSIPSARPSASSGASGRPHHRRRSPPPDPPPRPLLADAGGRPPACL